MPLFKKNTKTNESQALFLKAVDSTTFSVPEDPYKAMVEKAIESIEGFSDAKDEMLSKIVSSFIDLSQYCADLCVLPYCIFDEINELWFLGWSKNGCNLDLFTISLYKESYSFNGSLKLCTEAKLRCAIIKDSKEIPDFSNIEDMSKSFITYCLGRWRVQSAIVTFLSQTDERAIYLRQLEEYERPPLCSKP